MRQLPIGEIFPNSVRGILVDTVAPEKEDEDASYAGAPFTETEHEEEWMEWVNWDN